MAALIPLAISIVQGLISAIPKWIAAGKQNHEITDEQEAKWRADFEALKQSPAWQIDPDPS